VEYLARVWCSVEDPRFGRAITGRLRYMLTPLALIDLLAIAPFYLGMFVSLDARILRALRLLRVFKLSRHLRVMDVLLTVLRNEAATLASAILIMLVLVLLAATGIHLLEHENQPQAFGSIPQAMWWSAATLTTVGYGDVVPLSPWGRFFGAVITILGVGMAALPAGIIASGFTAEINRRRDRFEALVRRALRDGRLEERERHRLEEIQAELAISREDGMRIIGRVLRDTPHAEVETCPHCGKSVQRR
jgi:voltage-gated potassium channel